MNRPFFLLSVNKKPVLRDRNSEFSLPSGQGNESRVDWSQNPKEISDPSLHTAACGGILENSAGKMKMVFFFDVVCSPYQSKMLL